MGAAEIRMRVLFVVLALSLSACADHSPQIRWQYADTLASDAGWHRLGLETKTFHMAAYVPHSLVRTETLSVYIEGDGLAWLSRTQPSPDPTPKEPLGLQLALRHSAKTAVYLARPCQYVRPEQAGNCQQRYWTTHRFAPEVIESANEAITSLKARYQAKDLILIGYSGGAAVAALVAARRQDVVHLVTVAGNLDPRRWTELHRLTPLSGSLAPADYWQTLMALPQTHFVGSQDENIPIEIVESYAAGFPADRRPSVIRVDGQGHQCCWKERWPGLLERALDGQARLAR